ncbi:GAS2-like protein 1 isoform X1 [Globicephala melas]|uniref:GAS2-like protein 1 isoform X1 n=1 Tax=Globicephala melas TaxID=9731 RepID=UPI00293D9654|nr:GAS2-like protein 1 isoform X1 [Globicephala melas]XP_060166700.1 GAS2-like protein 1 isoform X1 [Globicephala melas]XP_060166701.1 GAS2-like protein 1 isoform X1 [Globicephala melas]
MADPVVGIAGSAAKSVRPFRSSEAYVEAMKEDLAEWLNALYGLGLPSGGDGFLTGLATGTTLCQHANAVTEAARAMAATRPARGVAFQAHSVAPGSFVARDNVATFIGWCRAELGVPEVLMFETEDLVLRKNEKSVVLCLLEVARRGARLGLLAPRLVQFEQEIEQELCAAPMAPNAPSAGEDAATAAAAAEIATAPGAPSRGPRMTPSDLRNLDELVREILGCCTCPDQFPMIKVSEGKYRVGDSSLLIFVRVLRSHVMVRVGGGWDTLEHYLDKHDPCRCSSTGQCPRRGRGGGTSVAPPLMRHPSSLPAAHRPPQTRARTFSPQRVSPTRSPRAGSPASGGERRGSRPEVTPISLRSSKEGPETPLRARDQLPPHPRSRRYSGDSDSSASSAQSGPLGARSEDSGTGPRRERPSRRVTTGTPASPRRPPGPRSQSRDRLDRGRPRGAPGGRGGQLLGPSPARRARSQSREEQAVLLVRRDRDGQHSWMPRGRSSPQTPRAHSPAAPRPPRVPSPSPELSTTPASVFRTPLQLDPKEEQQLFQRLEEEFLANARALKAAAGGTPTGPAPDLVRAPDPPAPDSAYCSSSSSSSSLSVLGGKCGQPADSGRMANGLPGPRGPALSSSSDEGNPCPGVGGPPDAPGSPMAGPEPLRTWARGRMDTQPDRKPSRIPTPRGPRRPSGPTESRAWHALQSVSPRAEPDSWM